MAVPGRREARASSGLIAGAALLGVGMGGGFDGIVFHQVLQWHHMLSTPTPPATLANLRLNTLADGLFHAATWAVTLLGLLVAWRSKGARRPAGSGRTLVGGMLAGWGSFNVVEGLIDHLVLGVHHVRPGPDQALYDMAFLAWGISFLVIGWGVARSGVGGGQGEAG